MMTMRNDYLFYIVVVVFLLLLIINNISLLLSSPPLLLLFTQSYQYSLLCWCVHAATKKNNNTLLLLYHFISIDLLTTNFLYLIILNWEQLALASDRKDFNVTFQRRRPHCFKVLALRIGLRIGFGAPCQAGITPLSQCTKAHFWYDD